MAKKLFVTGCYGQLGRAIGKEFASDPEYELVNTDVDDLDIGDVAAVMARITAEAPYAIINCAAYTNVDGCESNEDTAFRINAIGPRNLSIAAAAVGAKLVHISTDYVFEGNADHPYVETDPVNPQSAYGRTKLWGERYAAQYNGRTFILRTAWLYGEGKNFVRTMLNLSETRDTVSVVCDQIGSPTSAKELARAIHTLVPTDNYGIFHATCEGQCSWADFTREIFRLAGKDTKVIDITSDQYPTPTKRPAYSVLDNYMLRMTTNHTFLPWEEAIADYLKG